MDCREKGQYEEGVNLCNEVLGMKFDGDLKYHAEAHMQLGVILVQQGLYNQAMESFQSAVKMSPQDPRMHYELAVFYKQHGDRTGNKSWYNKAIIEFERTRMIDPDFADVSSELATLYKRK